MSNRSVVVLGGDAAALAVAGRLALDGHGVVLWEVPSAQESGLTGCELPRLALSGAGGDAVATLAAVTLDPFEALAAGDVLVVCALSHAQAFTDLVLPLLEPRHTLLLLPGNLGSLTTARWLRDRGRADLPTLVESDTAPFVAQRLAADRVHVSASVADLGFGVFPADRTAATLAVLQGLFPQARALAHVLAAALAGPEPFLRAPALLMSAGAVARRRTGCSLFEDGFTPAVARVAAALDVERQALGAALGIDLPSAPETLNALGLAPRGDLWAAVNGSFTLTHTPYPYALPAAGLADDGVLGLRPWAELAEQLGVPSPVLASLLTLFDAADGLDRSRAGRSLADLGLAGMNAAALGRFLTTGSDEPVR